MRNVKREVEGDFWATIHKEIRRAVGNEVYWGVQRAVQSEIEWEVYRDLWHLVRNCIKERKSEQSKV